MASAPRWLEPLRAQGPWAAAWILIATVVLCGLSLLPTHAASLVAGMLFGGARGSLLALAGIAGAALVGYRVCRWLGQSTATRALESRPRARAVQTAFLESGTRQTTLLLALVRLSPAMPFAGTNLAMACSGVGPGVFLAGSILGLMPRVVLVAYAGAGLEQLDLGQAADRRLALVGIGATVLALALIGRLARRVLRVREGASPESPAA